jgi:hydroxymethylbilane synthase
MDRPSPEKPLRIGTRGSPLALAQAHETRDRLAGAWDLPAQAFEIVVIRTTGDRVQDRPLKDLGGKGLFTREIEDALLRDGIDLAVHSTKDMPTLQPDGLVLDVFLPREDPRDALLGASSIAAIPEGATVGTSSLRRRAQLMVRRPDLRVVEFRGSVQTRLRKLEDGVARATFLAMAGLSRLDRTDLAATPIDPADMLPAVAQGAIGVERRAGDGRLAHLLAAIHHPETGLRVAAERAFLAALDGSCETPIAGLAEIDGGALRLRGEILRPDGSDLRQGEERGPVEEAAEMGHALGTRLLALAPEGFFDWRAAPAP